MLRKLVLLFWAVSTGILAFLCLNTWSQKHAPIYKKLEQQWAEDVDNLEASKKLPAAWNSIKEFKVIGGTPETKQILQRVSSPIKTNPDGKYAMEALIVVWEESGKRGALIQYNIEDLKTKNTVSEIGRTLILDEPTK